jgi:hypothetical protein
MLFEPNRVQRGILVLAGLFLLLFAFGTIDGYGGDQWLGTALFLSAVVCFVLSAASRNKTDG